MNMDRSVNIDDDGFVLVSKEAFKDDDAVSVRSDRSSLCMVDDPSADPGLFEDTDEDEGVRNAGKDVLESDASETAPLAKPEAIIQPERQSPKAIPSAQPKFVCQSCSVDIAAVADIVWEGYMGANVPAYLFKKAKNIETSAEPRQQQLSTGTFLVQDMKCRNCSTAFGWSYLKAWNQEQKYKEGSTIIQRARVHRVN